VSRRFEQLKKLLKIAQSPEFRRGLMRGVAANIEHKSVLQTFEANTIIDIGANRGQFALLARSCFPDADILSFEPLGGACEVFREVFRFDSKTSLYQVAIGPERADCTFHVSRRADSSSLLPITKTQSEVFPGTEERETTSVSVAPIFEMVQVDRLRGPIILKLDVQGYELQALKGCREVLPKVAVVIVECSFIELYEGQSLAGEVVAFLSQHGFDLHCVYNLSHREDGFPVQCDIAFLKRPSAT